MESESSATTRRTRNKWAARGFVGACLVLLVAIVGYMAFVAWAAPEQRRTSNRNFEQAKANIVRLTSWVAGLPAGAAGRGTRQGCVVGRFGQGPPWFWTQEYTVPYSDQAIKEITGRMRQLRDQGWRYVETSKDFEQTHTQLGVQVLNQEEVTIDMWRPSPVVIEDDAQAGTPAEKHTISIVGQSECTS